LAGRNGAVLHLTPGETHEIGDAEAMLTAALAGCGLVQLPMWMVREHLRIGALVAVLTEYATPKVDIHAVWPRTRHLAPKVRYVIDVLVAQALDGGLD
jgi:DNA-binding transcriptional LysR family regulator